MYRIPPMNPKAYLRVSFYVRLSHSTPHTLTSVLCSSSYLHSVERIERLFAKLLRSSFRNASRLASRISRASSTVHKLTSRCSEATFRDNERITTSLLKDTICDAANQGSAHSSTSVCTHHDEVGREALN